MDEFMAVPKVTLDLMVRKLFNRPLPPDQQPQEQTGDDEAGAGTGRGRGRGRGRGED
jgi:hypothetical protein